MRKTVFFALGLFILSAATSHAAAHLPEKSKNMVIREGNGVMAPGRNLPDVTGSRINGYDFVKEEIRTLRERGVPKSDYVGRIPPKAPASAKNAPAGSGVKNVPASPDSPTALDSEDMKALSRMVKKEKVRMPEPRKNLPVVLNPSYSDGSVPPVVPDHIDRRYPSAGRFIVIEPEELVTKPKMEPARETPEKPAQIVQTSPAQAPSVQAPPVQTQESPAHAKNRAIDIGESVLLEGRAHPGGPTLDNEKPVIENVPQAEHHREEDPYLTRRDVKNIPFAVKGKVMFFFCPGNADSMELWRDIRENRDVRRAMEEGKIEVYQPVWTKHGIPAALVHAWIKKKDPVKAFEFLDLEASFPSGWIDVADAGYLSEQERREHAADYLSKMETWVKNNGFDIEELYEDRGVQLGLAREMNRVNDMYEKLNKKNEKHPEIYVNGKRKEAFFEPIRSLPMHQR